jgi:hypothetical protein
MARHVSRRRAIREEFADEIAPHVLEMLEEFAFSLSPTWNPESEEDKRLVREIVEKFMDRYASQRNLSVPEADDDRGEPRPAPRRQRRTDPEGIEWRLTVFRGHAFALRTHDLPTQPQAKSIRTEASNLLTDLPEDHEARDEVFEILCAADDIVED